MDQNTPGLAMSRSFGDQVAARVGVISEPGIENIYLEIEEFIYKKDDKFIILASDGIWEFISNIEVAKVFYFIVCKYHKGILFEK